MRSIDRADTNLFRLAVQKWPGATSISMNHWSPCSFGSPKHIQAQDSILIAITCPLLPAELPGESINPRGAKLTSAMWATLPTVRPTNRQRCEFSHQLWYVLCDMIYAQLLAALCLYHLYEKTLRRMGVMYQRVESFQSLYAYVSLITVLSQSMTLPNASVLERIISSTIRVHWKLFS